MIKVEPVSILLLAYTISLAPLVVPILISYLNDDDVLSAGTSHLSSTEPKPSSVAVRLATLAGAEFKLLVLSAL